MRAGQLRLAGVSVVVVLVAVTWTAPAAGAAPPAENAASGSPAGSPSGSKPASPSASQGSPPAGPPAGVPPASPAAAGGGPATFAESIEVAVVSVDVVVRDRAGKQVPGLRREDFSLYVDGKKVEITNFLAGGGGPPPPAARTAPAHPAPPTPPTPSNAEPGQPSPPPQRERLNLVVYVDNANLRPFDRNRILKQLRAFLQKSLGEGDQVLLVTHDLGLHVRHPFRDSLSTLGPTLDKLEKENAWGITKGISARQTMEQIRDLGCERVDEAKGLARSYADQVLAEVKVTYSNLQHFLESLGGLEGRKILIYVGDGVATQVGTDVFGMIEETCSGKVTMDNLNLNTLNLLHKVTATANANRVTFYTLEGMGLGSYASAEVSRPMMSFALDNQVRADRQDSLTSLARETGGRAALNGNNFSRDLEEIEADLIGSYSLGFTPERAGDGKTRALRVEVNRQGLRASYRQSYRDRSPDERLQGQVEAALLHGTTDNPLAASLKLGAATASAHGLVQVAIQVRVPFGKLALVPQEDGRHGRVTILVGDMDARGGMSAVQRAQVPLRIPESDLKHVLATNMGYDFKLLLEPGRQKLAFAVRDEVARVSSCVIQELDVDKKGSASPVFAGAGAPGSR
ncbi:MAG TPA: VWA domain-containing protein [Thermoanaerobaculia bacterium]|nr:VWA domain-containing protein [Thermoanaerobaculia bacterium]